MKEKRTHIARKRFGQHFLHDPYVIAKIVRAIAPAVQDNMVEIGPGLGAITHVLLPEVKKLSVIEIDRDVILPLQERCQNLGELIIYQQDVLDFNFANLAKEKPLRVIGNLPYNISTPLLFHLFEYSQHIQDMVFMLQKEVAQRLAATPGSSQYGRLSVMAQYFAQVKILFHVGPGAFQPPPKVDSMIVKLIPHQSPNHLAKNFERFKQLVQVAFSARRKVIRKSLQEYVTEQTLAALNISPLARAEELSLEQFVALANTDDKSIINF